MTPCCLVDRSVAIPALQENLIYPIAGQKNTLKMEQEGSLEMRGLSIKLDGVTRQEQIH
jgi:hypothetical protein